VCKQVCCSGHHGTTQSGPGQRSCYNVGSGCQGQTSECIQIAWWFSTMFRSPLRDTLPNLVALRLVGFTCKAALNGVTIDRVKHG